MLTVYPEDTDQYEAGLSGGQVEYCLTGLVIMGFLVGLAFRLKVLLPIIGVVFVTSTVAAVVGGFGFLESIATVLLSQIALQTAYFLGVLTSAALGTTRTRSVL